KVAGIRLATFLQKRQNKKSWTENMTFFRPTFYFGDLLDSPFFAFIARQNRKGQGSNPKPLFLRITLLNIHNMEIYPFVLYIIPSARHPFS
ncbi:hypothetical protein, partial [Paenibacillus cookii]|uniref:hypothetical protein n=1 Tax=Paenibacillus cookii TaxID=157839 RepID=UPI001BB412DE